MLTESPRANDQSSRVMARGPAGPRPQAPTGDRSHASREVPALRPEGCGDLVPDPHSMIGATVSHYRVLEKLAQGGMGEVYLGEDTRLGRRVALKFLSPHLAGDPTARARFLREARTAAALDHPFICHIHETDEVEGKAFIAMEYVEGANLKERLTEGPLPLREAMVMGREVAEALTIAHRRRIVHRDLKPSNIMLTLDGHVKVLDFGLAKTVAHRLGAGRSVRELTALTAAGTIPGTMGYMSPEQLEDGTVDTRSDLFSFGVTLYEVLTGHHPFRKKTEMATAMAILTEEPPRLEAHLPEVPRELSELMARLLERDPERRIQTATEVRDELQALMRGESTAYVPAPRRPRPFPVPERTFELLTESWRRGVLGVVAGYLIVSWIVLQVGDVLLEPIGAPPWVMTVLIYLLIAGLPVMTVLAWIYDLTPLGLVKTDAVEPPESSLASSSTRRSTPAGRSIAVLPFANMTGDTSLEYFCDGMSEEITNVLTRVPDLAVAARTSAFAFKGKGVDIPTVGERLGVALVLDGSVRQHGELLRISAQLIRAEDGYNVWSDRYEERLEDVFAVQDDIADSIVGRLQPKLATEPKRQLMRRGTGNPDAYHEYLRGLYQWYARGLPKAVEHFSRAIALDPDYARARAGLADACTYSGFYGFISSRDAKSRAQAAALRAVSAQPELAEAHYSLGLVEFLFGWDLDAARAAFELAGSKNPGLAMPHAQLCQLHGALANAAAADEAAERALALEPLAPLVHATIGFANVFLHRYDYALDACRTALEIDPRALPAVWVMGTALIGAGQYDEAIGVLEKAALATERNNFILMWLGGAYALAGRTDDARTVVEELDASAAAGVSVLPACRAWIRAHLGEVDTAIELIEEATNQRNTQVSFFIFFRVPGIFDDPRFAALLKGTGIEGVLEIWRAKSD